MVTLEDSLPLTLAKGMMLDTKLLSNEISQNIYLIGKAHLG